MTPVERQELLLKRLAEFDRVTVDTRLKAGETQTFTFQYKEDPSNLESYDIKCKSCTKVKKDGANFEVAFTAPPVSDYAHKISQGQKEEKYTSTVSIYFNDGLPIQTVNENGELKNNPDKVAVSLQIRSTIEFA